jgi:hypothetical protein
MSKRRTADEVTRLLKDVDRDLAKRLTITDICRKNGIAVTTYYRWTTRRRRSSPRSAQEKIPKKGRARSQVVHDAIVDGISIWRGPKNGEQPRRRD